MSDSLCDLFALGNRCVGTFRFAEFGPNFAYAENISMAFWSIGTMAVNQSHSQMI
jgi:hypothetical protein